MKVYLSSTIDNLEENREALLLIRDTILEGDHELTRDWIPELLERGGEEPDRARLFGEIMQAIRDAEVCIFEITDNGMSLGFQVAYALERSKSTLLLLKKKDGHDSIDRYFISGYKSGFLTTRDYPDPEKLKKTVERFLGRYAKGRSTRINFILRPPHTDFIEGLAFEQKRSKTDIITEAIDEKMQRETKKPRSA